MAFQPTEEQRAAITDRGGALLVSAAAGSGKTRVLVERLLSYVEAGHDIDRFLVITYTRTAAAELRERIVNELSARLAQRPGDPFLRRQTALVYQAGISTVHSFCGQLLREEGHRLDLDRDFRLCEKTEADLLAAEVLNEVLDRRYEAIESDPEFASLVDTMSAGRDDRKLMEIVLDMRERIQSHPDPARWLKEQEEVFALEGVTDAAATPWGELLLEDVRRRCDYWRDRLEEALELCQGDKVLEANYAGTVAVTRAGLEELSRAAGEGWDAAKAACEALDFPRAGGKRGCEDPQAMERVKALRGACKKRMEKVQNLFQDDSAGLLEDMRAVYPALRSLFRLVAEFETAFAAEKRRRNWLDFSDLEHLAARLLLDEAGEPTELARRWGERYDEVMVDEYQDTNAVQNAIFTALTAEGQNLFMVGDVKQSIYRFRLADPTIFLSKYRAFRPRAEAAPGEPRRVLLTQNFRSRSQVLEGCNYLFRSVMSREFGEMDYTDDEALRPGRTFPAPEDPRYRVELDLLDCSQSAQEPEEEDEEPREESGGEETSAGPKVPRDLLEARFAAQRIRALLEEGFPVCDGKDGLRPATAGDVVILLRSPGTVLHHYAAALSEAGLLWEADGVGDFFAAEEIQVALSLLRIVDNPRQDVALIAALRSPVWAMSADRLSQIRSACPGTDFYTALSQDGGADARDFLAQLEELRGLARDESCDKLLWQLYDRTDLLGIYGALTDGEERRANLLLLEQLARDYQGTGHKGLFDFLRYLTRLEEADKDLVLPRAVGGDRGVKILSIHRSKGLEYPIVLLCGLSRQLNKTDVSAPLLFHPRIGVGPKRLDTARMVEYPTLARLAVARQMEYELSAEELRLLYVAMTRAQEKLILSCALSRGRKTLDELLPAAGSPVEPQALLDCSLPAQWVLLCALARPEARDLLEGALPPVVSPGVDFGPVWEMNWVDASPFVAPLRPRGRRERREEGERHDTGADLSARFAWSYPHAGEVDLPSKLTATQLKGRDLDGETAQDAPPQTSVPARPPRFDRPRFAAEKLGLTGAQRGTALHLVMQFIRFDRCHSLEGIRDELTRLEEEKFLTAEQIAAVDPVRIQRFFDSPLGRELTEAKTLRREFKFSLLVPARRYFPAAGEGETVLLQGVVDCYFETEAGITVVDFKTDAVHGDALAARAREYRPQLTAYAEALCQITGRPVNRQVLWFFSEDRPVEL